MAFRIGLLRSSALPNDGRTKPVILQCRAPQETDPKGHWGQIVFLYLKTKCFCFIHAPRLGIPNLTISGVLCLISFPGQAHVWGTENRNSAHADGIISGFYGHGVLSFSAVSWPSWAPGVSPSCLA